jgi:uncharacterized protein (TIGR00251 family)
MTALWIKEVDQGILFKIIVQPRASDNRIIGLHGDALKIKLTAPPVDGAANKMVVAYLSKCLNVPKSRLEIKTGHTGRQKQILLRYAMETPLSGETDRIRQKIEMLAKG